MVDAVHPVASLVDELLPCVRELIVQPQVRRFQIGRTSDLRRRAARQSCDGIVSLHGADDHRVIAGLEEALSTSLAGHPKRLVADEARSYDTEVESRYVYLAVWYKRDAAGG